jgi:hypothetical protein
MKYGRHGVTSPGQRNYSRLGAGLKKLDNEVEGGCEGADLPSALNNSD